ncbi:hypothetical protein OG711_15450 [Streptomyces uncialis]|uniref:hypothetical protein n=2 Tax=Streptomyces TaxID=1883 RepID=UPI002E3280CC|nr:hypothetical protein [Streptomyces uncialis]
MAQYAELLSDANRSWPSYYTGPLPGDEPTHVEMFFWRGDEAGWIGDKSNFETARDLIRGVADERRTDTELSDEQVYECGGGSSAWDVAQLYVQVYEGGCPAECPGTHTEECRPGCDPYVDFCHGQECEGDCHGTQTFTPAFRTAVALAEYVKNDHPFLSEDDYHEQRRDVFEANLDEVLEDVKLHYPYDTEGDHRSIVEHASDALWELYHYEPDGYVDWDAARDAYDQGRSEHFLDLGRTVLRNEIPGQTALMPA